MRHAGLVEFRRDDPHSSDNSRAIFWQTQAFGVNAVVVGDENAQ